MSAPSQQANASARPGWLTVLIDLAALTLPWLLIFKQAGILFTPPATVSEPILWLAGAMLGVPGVAQIVSAVRSGGTTPPESLPAAPAASPPSSPSSSTSGAEA